ncbi:hypothetical protein DD606_25335 [Enterobacter cloacae complex sp. GF14B]|nr:hypothetical protein DD606_25335 [Enterobacter cloacae complex sp. GF14B]
MCHVTHKSLISFNPRATKNFIYPEFLKQMDFEYDQFAGAIEAELATGDTRKVVPLIGALSLTIQGYHGKAGFHIMKLGHCNSL